MKKSKLTKVIVSSLILASVISLKPAFASSRWVQDKTGWYYTEGNSWATGWKLINGDWYYFNTNGYMAHDTTIDGCRLNSDGKWIQQEIILATIGTEKITKTDFDKEMQKYDETLKQKYGNDYATNVNIKNIITEIKKKQLQTMIIQKVLLQKATELNLKPSDADLNKQVITEVNNYKTKYSENGQFENILKQSNVTEDEFKEIIKNSIIEKAVEADMFKDVTIQDTDIQAYYDQNKDSEFVTDAGANVSHILVADEATAKKLKAELDAGADFSTLAKENSIDPGTKNSGGSLGFIPYNYTKFVAEFMDGFKNLKEGEISDPVKSQFGYHLIKVTGIKDSAVISFDDAKDKIKAKLLNTKEVTIFNTKITQWEKDLNVKTYENNL